MRTIICLCFAVLACQLRAQGDVSAPVGSYAAEIPHGDRAKAIFRVSIGDFSQEPAKMQIVAHDVASDDDVIILRAPVVRRRRVIKAEFAFGGRFLGHYIVNRNVIVGRFAGFARRGSPSIPRNYFELAPVNTNALSVALSPN
jgi:hypothetical protein